MKILEISGCNLASLKDKFCISLDKPPFTRDGLFAIRGVMGSGKSTLIDAMCLALYDDTPRFVGRGGPKIGMADQEEKERIAATDSRSILHRGASQGWAEVVFRGVDGNRWRAKWTVARAHKKADGRFKNQEMELENQDSGQIHTGNRTDILKLIREKVGLTFEQFRRSVLLAQGEFAAFAKANEDERASLLEAMTGTSIYAKVSEAAQKRSAQEEQKLKELNTEREALGLLSEESRREKDSEVGVLTGQITQQEKEQTGVLKELGWYERCLELEKQQSEAARKADSTQAAFVEAEARRQLLQAVDSAQPLRPIRANVFNAREHRSSLEKQIAVQTGDLPAAEQTKQESQKAFQDSQQALTVAVKAIEDAKPGLNAAHTLDTRIQDAQRLLLKASDEAAKLRKEALGVERIRDDSIEEEKRLSKRIGTVEQELEASSSIQVVAQSWPRIEKDIQSFGKGQDSLKQAQARLAKLQGELKTQKDARSKVQTELDELASGLSLQQVELDTLEKQMTEEPRAVLDESRKTHQSRLDQNRKAETNLQRLHPLLDLLATAEAEAQTQASAKAKSAEDKREADRQLLALESGLVEARSALEKALTAMSLNDHRQQLVEGEACPLCGSLEHPWATGSPLAGLLESQRERVEELAESKAQLEAARTTANNQMTQADKAEAKALKESKTHAANAQKEELAWAEARRALPDLPEDGRSQHAMTLVREGILDLEEAISGIVKREAALLKLEKRAEKLRREQRDSENKRKGVDGQIARLDQECQGLEITEAQYARDITNLDSGLKGQLDALAPVLGPSAMDDLNRDPESLRASLAASVAKRKESESSQIELTGKIGELAKALEGQRARATEKRSTATDGEERQKGSEKALGGLQEERKGYFEGRSVGEVERGLETHRRAAEKNLEEARIAFQAADKAVGELHNTITTLQDQLAKAKRLEDVAQREFAEALSQWGGKPDDLESLLAWTSEQIQEERAALQEIERVWSRAKAVVEEHQRTLDTHRASGHPERVREELDALVQSSKAALDDLKNTLGGLQADLRRDDQARQNAASLAVLIREQEGRTKLWKEMNDLIGSSDGKKFRTFAQSLTLEALVAFANDHLARLNPRYRLQRIPGYELELQVIDQDMGDEIRALNSLSGGETFLVSLALALGLSSLSASDTPIDSLFIDEGFGTLDSETLETALSVLDELQSQGRQVGIISHVDGLATHIPMQITVEKLGGGRSRVVPPTLGRAG